MNRSSATEAIILRTNPVGELHRGLVLLSKTQGLVRAIAHGANTPRGKLRGSTVVFSTGTVFLYTNPTRQSTKITDMDAREYFTGIRADIRKYYTASLWAELILKTYASGGHAEDLFHLLVACLAALNSGHPDSSDLVSVQFLWRFLGLSGSQPDLSVCACCGEYLEPHESVSYSSTESGFCSADHGCADAQGFLWSAGARAYLRHTSTMSIRDALQVEPPSGAAAAIKSTMHAIAQELVEAPLNTLKSGAGII